jgi:hypothetical protein
MVATAFSSAKLAAASVHRPLRIPPLVEGRCTSTPIGLLIPDLGEFRGSGPVYTSDINGSPLAQLP